MNKTYLALAFLIAGFILAGNAYGEGEDGIGMWACLETVAFAYKDGKNQTYIGEKFILKIKEDTVSYSGSAYRGKGTLEVIAGFPNMTAISQDALFQFDLITGQFAWANVFNFADHRGPEFFNRFGTCEKFDTPE